MGALCQPGSFVIVDSEMMDRGCEVCDASGLHKQSFDLIVDQTTQVGVAPPDDRYARGQRLRGRGSVCLHPARERERVSRRQQSGDRVGIDRAVDDDTIAEVGSFEPAPNAVGVLGCQIGASDQMEGHVVRWEVGHGVEQFDDSLIWHPVGDTEQSEATRAA
jgi:hypothetical protein